MKDKKSRMVSDVDNLIFNHFESKLSKIEAKYPFEKNITIVSDERFEKRKARVINILAAACIAIIFGLGALKLEPPRHLDAGIKHYYEYHDFENQIPVAMEKTNNFLDKYK